MGRVRSALRSYALEDYPPDEVLRLVDRKVRHFEVGALLTATCAVSSPPYDQFQVVVAGHPPPVLAVPGQVARLVDVDVRPPLGVGTEVNHLPTTILLPPGGVLVLYTDGLVERRHEVLDVGFARLCAAVTVEHPEIVCRHVMRKMVGSHKAQDDVAVIALRRTDNDLNLRKK